MGFRATAQNLNLNRDYLKADAPEMRDWLKLWSDWLPDFLVDIHTTDGADYQYDLTWYTEDWGPLDAGVKAWQDEALKKRVFAQMEKRGHLVSPYLELKDHRDITKGIENFGSGQRFSTGYVALQNRAGLLVETHMLKSYATRVRATYDLIVLILDELRAHPGELRKATAAADQHVIARAAQADASLPILFAVTEKPETLMLKGFAFTQTHSDISGDVWTQYDPSKAKTFEVPNWRDLVVMASRGCAGRLSRSRWLDRSQREAARTRAAHRDDDEAHYAACTHDTDRRPALGRLRRSKDTSCCARSTRRHISRSRPSPQGSALVPLDQRAANVVVNLLEPRAPDSLLRWGFFNAAVRAEGVRR